jgi:ABC-type nitrate/sulfonate/bicarbonate transport system permease component
MRRWAPPVVLLAALLGAWQLAASSGAMAEALGLESFLVPSPAEIAGAIWENRSLLAENAWVTLREIVLGFGCALIAGVGFAILMHLSGVVLRATYPLIVATQTVPVIVLAPILIVWFGYGIGAKLAIVALVCFFPITVNVLDGLGAVDPEAIKLMRTLYASRWQRFRRLEAPSALPGFFTGAKIAIVFAPIGAIFGEWVGANAGLGHEILQDNAQLEIARVFGAVVVLAAIGIGLFGLLALAERRVVTWR